MAEERAQRRLAAILAADVVGYSRLMGHSEVGTLAALKLHRRELVDERIAEHQGRIVKLTGDGMLVEFASVVNAVACAVEIQRRMIERNADVQQGQQIQFRIGINLGDIIVENNDIFGDGVNVAVRIESIAPPGGIAISKSVRESVGNRLDLAFEDMGDQTLKNIDQPVRVYSISLGEGLPRPTPAQQALARDKPSIAVLPFTNMSGDAEQNYFTDGITEDIITEISRFNGLLVIARHSSFAYRGRAIDTRQIGRELGAQYLLEGSIRVVGTRARITAQLIDTNNGSHLWAERYERNLSDIFAIQDEISQAIASMAVLRLQDDRLERVSAKSPNSITAYEWSLRGKRAFELSTAEGMVKAQKMFEKALENDPNYARAIAGLALVHNMATSVTGWGVSLDEPHERALSLARTAALLDPTDHVAEIILGWCHMFRREYGEAKRHFDRAHALNPNDADGLLYRSIYLAYTAQCQEAAQTLTQAFRLNPNYPDVYLSYAAGVHILCRHYDAAVDLETKVARDIWPESPGWLAVAHAHLGNLDKARSLGEAFRHNVRAIWRGDPNVDDKELVRWFFLDNPIQHAADIDHFLAGLRIAGLEV
jgi:TolB-like protein/class 3 adenylate cyclase/Tfp pilus assembly protein PilF